MKHIRNKIFHSADFKMSDTDLKNYIEVMTSMLEDPTQLMTDAKAKHAVQQLHKVTSPLRKVAESKQICRKRTMYVRFQINENIRFEVS